MSNDTVVSMSAPARVREVAVVGSCGIAKSVRDLPRVDLACGGLEVRSAEAGRVKVYSVSAWRQPSHVDGYGIGVPGTRGIVTPYAGLFLSEGSSRRYRTGARWNLAPGAVLGLEATRQGGANGTAETTAIAFRTELRW